MWDWMITLLVSSLYLWIGLAFAKAYLITRQQQLLLKSLSFFTEVWIVIVIGILSPIATLFLMVYPLATVGFYLKGYIYVPGYFSFRDVLFFRRPSGNKGRGYYEQHQVADRDYSKWDDLLFLINMVGLLSATTYNLYRL